jgi:hypothetical protein
MKKLLLAMLLVGPAANALVLTRELPTNVYLEACGNLYLTQTSARAAHASAEELADIDQQIKECIAEVPVSLPHLEFAPPNMAPRPLDPILSCTKRPGPLPNTVTTTCY